MTNRFSFARRRASVTVVALRSRFVALTIGSGLIGCRCESCKGTC